MWSHKKKSSRVKSSDYEGHSIPTLRSDTISIQATAWFAGPNGLEHHQIEDEDDFNFNTKRYLMRIVLLENASYKL